MQGSMRKPSRKQGDMVLKRPQRGLGVAELERIRLQEEQDLLLYHHKQQQQQQHQDSHFNLHYQQLPFFSTHHDLPPFNPNFINPNPNFINPNLNFLNPLASPIEESPPTNPNFINPSPNFINPLASPIEESPPTNPPYAHASPTKPSLSPSLPTNPSLNPALVTNPKCSELLKNSSEFMLSHSAQPPGCPSLLPSKPSLMNTHTTFNEQSEFLLPYAITPQQSPFTNPSFAPNLTANPNVTPIHNTNPNLKINRNAQLWLNSASTLHSNPNTSPGLSTLMEHSFFPLHTSPFEVATQPSLTYHATDHFMYLATSPNVENPSSLPDSSLNPPPSIHEHNCKALKKNIPAVQDAEVLELPSFQNIKQQQIIGCGYEKKYMRCNLDLNNTQGEYELAYNTKINPRTKIISSGDTSIFGGDTSPRDGFLKLGLPTITEEWNQGSMQTKILEHFNERTMNPGMELYYHALYGQMVKENKPNIDLELKLSLPSFGYQ